MWKFWNRPTSVALTEKMQSGLVKERGVSAQAAASLRMVVERGRYCGRRVTYFRVFDPTSVGAAGVDLQRFADLGSQWTLHAGHIEADGAMVLIGKPIES